MRLMIIQASGDIWGYLEPGTSDEIAALECAVAQGEWTIGRGDESMSRLRALAELLDYPATEVHEPPSAAPLRRVIVQRGEIALAERLRTLTPPGVPVIFDRRTHDRRIADQST